MIAVGYMGTKRYLADAVATTLGKCKEGIVLDAFSGMCSVGQAVANSRVVWNNDTQVFASEVAKAMFTSTSPPLSTGDLVKVIFDHFCVNQKELVQRFEVVLGEEKAALNSEDSKLLIAQYEQHKHAGNSFELAAEMMELSQSSTTRPYRLATLAFSVGYFGIAQSIEIDSIRYAIDTALVENKINSDQHRWALIALCLASAKIATTTGHFAQFLKPNVENFKRFKIQRKKSVWSSWLECSSSLSPLRTLQWRKKNKVFNQNSLSLFSELSKKRVRPSVIYADPPYTADHYSRYYHVWDTLVKYDYPEVHGVGRYRPDRFTTPFSIKTLVNQSMHDLIEGCCNLGADLVLSYPDNGLLCSIDQDPLKILKKFYESVEISACLDYRHSTMGASNGQSKNNVKELIYLARN